MEQQTAAAAACKIERVPQLVISYEGVVPRGILAPANGARRLIEMANGHETSQNIYAASSII